MAFENERLNVLHNEFLEEVNNFETSDLTLKNENINLLTEITSLKQTQKQNCQKTEEFRRSFENLLQDYQSLQQEHLKYDP